MKPSHYGKAKMLKNIVFSSALSPIPSAQIGITLQMSGCRMRFQTSIRQPFCFSTLQKGHWPGRGIPICNETPILINVKWFNQINLANYWRLTTDWYHSSFFTLHSSFLPFSHGLLFSKKQGTLGQCETFIQPQFKIYHPNYLERLHLVP